MHSKNKKFQLSRRHLLKGMGVSLALPWLEIMVNDGGLFFDKAYAQGAEKTPRLVLFHWPQGVAGGWKLDENKFHPKYRGRIIQAGKTVPDLLNVLSGHLNDINVVTGMYYGPIENHVGSHGHASAFYTGYKPVAGPGESGVAQRASVDEIASLALGSTTPIKALRTAGPGGLDAEAYWSWKSAGQKNAFYTSPSEVFTMLTNAGASGGSSESEALKTRRLGSINLIKNDISRLQARLGREDLIRLDSYLEFVNQIEQSINATENVTCGDISYTIDNTKAGPIMENVMSAQKMDDASCIMVDLQVLALSCDITRVSFHSMGRTGLAMPLDGTDYHECTHGWNTHVNPLNDSVAKFMGTLNYFISQLKATQAGDYSLWDSCVLAASSEFSHGSLHSAWNPPIIVGGQYKPMNAGNHVIFPHRQYNQIITEDWQQSAWHLPVGAETNSPRCINDLWQTVLTTLGVYNGSQVFGADPGTGVNDLYTAQVIANLWQQS